MFMQLVQMSECGGFDLIWADRLRKSIAKKNPADYEKLQKEYFKQVKEKKLSEKLCNYVWNVLVATSRGYGFNKSHTLAYSLIALQEMNLAYKYPIIFWNCACLITDSGGVEAEKDGGSEIENEEPLNYTGEIEDFGITVNEYDEEDEEGYECTIVVDESGKKKKKTRSANFGKIATAIGKMKSVGIEVTPPDINQSAFTFSPDANKNIIRFGLSGIVRIGEDLIHSIIENRPYSSLNDFLSKVKINKPQMVNLIKAGAFDSFGNREEIMKKYIIEISDTKKRITLQNMKMLIDFKLIPEDYDFECRVYNFNKYLKKMKLDSYYGLDNIAMAFFDKYFDIDLLIPTEKTESGFKISQIKWDKIYQAHMDIVRPYVKEHNKELLEAVNSRIINEMWKKYCLGSLSKWEMDAVSCYFHEHELTEVNLDEYQIADYFDLPENPEIDKVIPIKGKQIPLFKIYRIAGTVLDKDKNKKTISLLTKDGVVNVKIFGPVFANYDKQISEKDSSGKKHVIEKSVFSRGNKIIVSGIRREDSFVAKKYARTPWSLVELITNINENGSLEIQKKRYGEVDN